jgi:hypothetical protein
MALRHIDPSPRGVTSDSARGWELAAASFPPRYLARMFVAMEGQFYDRVAYDDLARRVFALIARDDAAKAWEFRARLDARLYQRFAPRVRWRRRPAAVEAMEAWG